METKMVGVQWIDVYLAFDYDCDNGHLICKYSERGGRRKGCRAGSYRDYVYVRLNGKTYMAHQLIWLLVTQAWPDREIDHVNGDRLDNRFCNLRLATRSENACNIKLRSDNKTGYKGVSITTNGQYVGIIHKDGIRHYCGRADTAEGAYMKLCAKRAELHDGFYNDGKS